MIDFNPFRQRVRLLRSLSTLAWGLVLGGVIGALFVAAVGWHWVDLSVKSPLAIALVFLALAGFAGWVYGWTRPWGDVELAKSLDVRAHTQDRLATAAQVHEGDLADALNRDASAAAAKISPKQAYPFHWGLGHSGAVVSCALPFLAFLSLSVPGLVDPNGVAERKEVKSQAGEVERVAKEVESQAPKSGAAPQNQELSQALRKLSQDMRAERVDRHDQQQRANEIKKLANELAKSKADQAQQQLTTAKEAMRKMEKAQSTPMELSEQQKQVLGMSEQERADAARKVEAQMEANNRQIEAAQTELRTKPMSAQERKAAEQKVQEKIKQQEELAKQLKDLKMDPKVLEQLRKEMQDPSNAELKKMMDDLQKKLSETQQKANQQTLSKEDLEKLKEQAKQMEEQLKQIEQAMKDPAQKKMMMEALKQALQNAQNMGDVQSALELAKSLGQMQGGEGNEDPGGKGGEGKEKPEGGKSGKSTKPEADSDLMTRDTGHVDLYDKPQAEVGKTQAKSVTGKRQDSGDESYMEVKGPADLAGKSSVPTVAISPSAARKAEQAITRGKIPARHSDRVRSYFDSLSRPKTP